MDEDDSGEDSGENADDDDDETCDHWMLEIACHIVSSGDEVMVHRVVVTQQKVMLVNVVVMGREMVVDNSACFDSNEEMVMHW